MARVCCSIRNSSSTIKLYTDASNDNGFAAFFGLNDSMMSHTTSAEQVRLYLLVVDPVVPESCDKGTDTIKGLREGQP